MVFRQTWLPLSPWARKAVPRHKGYPRGEGSTQGEISRHFAETVVDLRKEGTPLLTDDVWIAAPAARAGALVLTKDDRYEKIAEPDQSWLPTPRTSAASLLHHHLVYEEPCRLCGSEAVQHFGFSPTQASVDSLENRNARSSPKGPHPDGVFAEHGPAPTPDGLRAGDPGKEAEGTVSHAGGAGWDRRDPSGPPLDLSCSVQ